MCLGKHRVYIVSCPDLDIPADSNRPRSRWAARSIGWFIAVLLMATAIFSSPLCAAPSTGFSVQDVVTGIEQPISLRFLPDGRMIVLQKRGKVLIANVTQTPIESAVYMDLADLAHTAGLDADQERGVLDMAVDPAFPSAPYIYIFYTPANGPAGPRARVSRFTHLANSGGITSRGNLASEVVLWEDTQGYDSCCHFGGGLDFGPDGNLWLSTGDHFQGSYASSLQAAGGSIHRFRKDGSIPADNPYVQNTSALPSIFAYGLRNPFRSRWDFPSGRYFIGEVGGNTQSIAWEDLHVIRYVQSTGKFVDSDYGTTNDNGKYDGINFGWPTVEGLAPHTDFPGATIDPIVGEPIFAYRHNGSTSAITGGVVYRGSQFPAEYQGAYFYADSTRDFVRYLKFDANGNVAPNPNPDPLSLKNPETASYSFDLAPLGRVVFMEVGPDGALYFVSFTDAGGAYGEPNPYVLGAVRRYVYDGGNARPVVREFTATPVSGTRTVNFQIRADDFEGDSMTYLVRYGDGTTSGSAMPLGQGTTLTVSHTYAADGVYQAKVEVSDGKHTTPAEASTTVQVGTKPVITSLFATNSRSGAAPNMFRFGDTITFAATATDAEDGALGAAKFSWSISFVRPGNTHPSFGPVSGVTSIDFPIPMQGQGFSGPVYYRCFLTVTDSSGLTTVATTDIFPEKTNITFATVPSGIVAQIDGNTARATPFTLDTLIGFPHVVTLQPYLSMNGRQYQFSHWSNGATTSQILYPAPETDTTLTGFYNDVGEALTVPAQGLAMHLTVEAGLIASGSSVTGWEDQTSNGNDLQALGNPALVSGGTFFPNVVHFDGVDDAMAASSFLGLPVGNADRSVFLVCRYNSVNSDGPGWAGFAYGVPLANQTFGLALTPWASVGVQGWGGANDAPASVATPIVGNWITHAAILKNGVLQQYVNGNLVGTTSHAFNTGSGGMSLGEELNGGKNLNMEVAEVIVYNRAISAAEMGSVANYVASHYGLGEMNNVAPSVNIATPQNGAFIEEGVSLNLAASATDPQQGDLSSSIVWVSNLDGVLGSGASLTKVLSPGVHTITAQVVDRGGLIGSASVFVSVAPAGGATNLLTSGLVLQLESDLNVAMQSGNVVAGWLDQSGLGNDLVAGGAPKLVAGQTPSGQPAIVLNGSGDLLQRSGSLGGIPGGNANRTMFIVARYNGASAWAGVAYGAGAENQAYGLNIKAGSGELGLQGWGSGNDLVSSTAGMGAGWLVQSGTVSNGMGTLYKNGAQIAQFAHTYSTALTRLVIGEEIAHYGFVQMDVAAVLIYNRALSASERASVEAYLHAKYLQPAPVGNTAPTVSITAPAAGSSFVQGTAVSFTATASDAEDGNISSAVTWTSNLDGNLGSGATVSANLSVGSHTITATVKDAGNVSQSASISVTITPPGVINPNGLLITGLVVQLETDQGVPTQGAGTLTAWQDQSGSGNDLLAKGAPKLNVTQTPAGKAAISLNGSTDYLERNGSLVGLPASNADRTMFVVAKYNSANAWAGVAYGTGANNQAFGLNVKAGSGELGLQGWGSGNDLVSATAGVGAGWLVQSGSVSNGTVTLYKNGAQIGQFAHTYNTTLSRLVVGEEIAHYGFVQMDVAAVLIYNRALNPSERAGVEAYLYGRYLQPAPPANTAPTINITAPAANSTFPQGTSVTFTGTASDAEDGILSSAIRWSSNVSGNLGTGASVAATLTTGAHTITATVTDAGNISRTASVNITITPAPETNQEGLLITGLVLQLEADSQVTLQSGNTVAGWSDRSGKGNNLVAGGAPKLNVVQTPSGKPAITFNGTSDLLKREGSIVGFPQGNADRTMFLVARYNDANVWAGAAYGTGANNQAFGLIARSGSGRLGLQGWGNGNDLVSTTAGVGAGWMVQSGSHSGGTASLYKDGTQIAQFTHTYNTGSSRFVIGEEIAHYGFVKIDVAAVLIYDRALTSSERASVDAYLRAKYFQ